MKNGLSLIVILTGLNCCTPKHSQEPVIAEQLMKDRVLNEAGYDPLTAKQIKEIGRIHTAFSEVDSRSLENTINHFRRHPNPDREIKVWLKMADAYERFTLPKHIEEYDKKYEAYQLILHRSGMTAEEVIEKVHIRYLTNNEVNEILGYYVDPP